MKTTLDLIATAVAESRIAETRIDAAWHRNAALKERQMAHRAG